MSYEISTENIVDAQSQHYKAFEKNRINVGGAAHKRFGDRTFYADSRGKEVIIFIPDFALTYKRETGRNNMLILFEDKAKSVVFVFADTPNILRQESCLKTEIRKDEFFESNIKQIKEIMLFFCGTGRPVDVLCHKSAIKKLKEIPPFNNNDANINFLNEKEARKIATKMSRFESGEFKAKKFLIMGLIILSPALALNHFATSKIVEKNSAEQSSKLREESAFYALREELAALKEDELYKRSEYYRSLTQKKVMP